MKKPARVERDLTSHARFSRIEPYMYLLPFLIGILAFTLYPVINVIFMSFKEDYSYLTREFAQWGVGNYEKVFADPKFEQAIANTLKYVVLVVPSPPASPWWWPTCSTRNCASRRCSRRPTFCPWSPPSPPSALPGV